MTLTELIQKASDGPLTRAEVGDFCSHAGITFPAFCDEFSRVVATGYFGGTLSYTFCDGAMNNLFAFMTLQMTEDPLPDYSYSVFLAFDAGEYYHREDSRNSSPEELYTKPMIADILSNATNA